MDVNLLNDDVHSRIKDLFSVFESLEIHVALMVVKKSVMFEVQNFGTPAGKKFLQLNPDIGMNFLDFCAFQTTIPVSHAEMSDNTSSAEDYSFDTQSFPYKMSESPTFESPEGLDSKQVRNKIMTASLFKSAFDPEAKMSAENGTLNTPRINMVKDSEPFQDLTSVRTEENSDSEGSDCKAVSDENECSDGASVSELIIYPEEKMSEASVTLRTPRVKMEKEIEPRHDLTSVEMEENSISEIAQALSKKGKKKTAYPCPIKDCMEILSTHIQMTRHVFLKHSSENLCVKCGGTFSSFDSLNEHMDECSVPGSRKWKVYECEICDEKCRGKLTLVRHRLLKHSTKHQTCNVCGKGFSSMSLFQDHIKRSHFKCTQCEEKFKSKPALNAHMKKHKTERKQTLLKCEQCSEAFDSKSGLCKHQKQMHSKPKYQCKCCGKCYLGERDLNRHEQTHKEYKCQYCGKCVTTEQGFRIHLNIHTKENMFICEICGAEFCHRASLRLHRKRHIYGSASIKRSKNRCKFCPSLFDKTAQLARHLIENHLEEALASKSPYIKKCEVCSKVYNSEQFQRHMNIHTNTKEHKCVVCFKAFVVKDNAYSHMVRVHKMVKYSCKVCRRVFWSEVDLDNHCQKEHA